MIEVEKQKLLTWCKNFNPYAKEFMEKCIDNVEKSALQLRKDKTFDYIDRLSEEHAKLLLKETFIVNITHEKLLVLAYHAGKKSVMENNGEKIEFTYDI